ncbi:MAG: hypothetical protein IKJ35_02135 [Clostridia bacterium]|nr:hypothetical protein [Clostridia bacterium]
MGKGSRNRQIHLQDRMDHPEKYKEKKQMPKWVGKLVAWVLLVAVVIGVAAYIISSNSIIERNRILVDSKSGKFDVNQRTAEFIAWQNEYSNAATYWTYCSYGFIEDTYDITKNYKTADEYALGAAQFALENNLRDSIDNVLESLKIYVAVCDKAYEEDKNYHKSDAIKASVNEQFAQFEKISTSNNWPSVDAFLSNVLVKGLKASDVEKALTMLAVYDAYCTEKQVSFETATTLKDLETFRDANPEDYYKNDYFTFATEDKALADQLAACKTPEEFKALVLNNHFDKNYKTAYNKFTVQKDVAKVLADLKGKTDSNAGTALTDALNTLGFEEAKTYNSTDEGLNAQLKSWLFDAKRKQHEVGSVETEDGIYVLAFFSEKNNETTVSVREKFYQFEDGITVGEDTEFKNNVLKYLQEYKTTQTYPEVSYQMHTKKAEEFEKTLKAEGADVAAILAAAENKTTVDALKSTDKTHPEAVVKAVFEKGVAANDILKVEGTNASYVVYVEAIGSDSAKITYVTFESDLYYQVISDLTTSLDKIYPTVKSINHTKDAAADSFEAWISVLNEGTLTSARTENETKTFETTKDNVTTHSVYMVTKTMYLDTSKVVYGGYYLYSSSNHATDAETAKNNLAGKTNAALASALSSLGGTSSYTLLESSITDANLKAWLFSADRKANEVAVVKNTTGTGSYVAVFVESGEAWHNNAKNAYVSEQMQNWVDGLAKDYRVNERAVAKLGEPSTTVATTAAPAPEETTAPAQG